jgi:hypothetical protein
MVSVCRNAYGVSSIGLVSKKKSNISICDCMTRMIGVHRVEINAGHSIWISILEILPQSDRSRMVDFTVTKLVSIKVSDNAIHCGHSFDGVTSTY